MMIHTLSPGTLLGLTFLMMHTASTTSRTPSGGRCIARTSTTSFLFRDLRLASAASCSHTGKRLHVSTIYLFIYLFIIKSYSEYNKHIKEKKEKVKTKRTQRKNTEKKLKNKKYTNSYKAYNKTPIRHCNKINKSI